MTIGLKADPSGTFGSITINGTEAIRVNPNGMPATSIAFTPSGNIAAANVQAAIQELDTETQSGLATKLSLSGGTMTGQLNIDMGGISGQIKLGPAANQYFYGNATEYGIVWNGATLVLFSSSGYVTANNGFRQSGAQEIVANALTRKDYVDSNFVGKAANNTLTGQNRFTQGIYINGPATGYEGRIYTSDRGVEFDTNSQFRDFFFTKANGSLVGSVTGHFIETSDYRIKENVQGITGALSKLSALRPVSYTYKADTAHGRTYGTTRLVEGFIAHELAEVIPYAVTGEKDAVFDDGTPNLQAISKGDIVPLLVAAIQELSAKVAELEARLA